jgi:hypothetical protein
VLQLAVNLQYKLMLKHTHESHTLHVLQGKSDLTVSP